MLIAECYLNYVNRCGQDIQMWKPSLVKVTGDVLQDAWRFYIFIT